MVLKTRLPNQNPGEEFCKTPIALRYAPCTLPFALIIEIPLKIYPLMRTVFLANNQLQIFH